MSAPLVLTGEESERIQKLLELLMDDFPARTAGCQNEIAECLKILLAPRTEALGLSKEEWEKEGAALFRETGHDHLAAACAGIASSLSDKGEA
jgi:hypothetical protein